MNLGTAYFGRPDKRVRGLALRRRRVGHLSGSYGLPHHITVPHLLPILLVALRVLGRTTVFVTTHP